MASRETEHNALLKPGLPRAEAPRHCDGRIGDGPAPDGIMAAQVARTTAG